MSVKCALKKVIHVLIPSRLVICILSISIFSILIPQLSHGQEADKIAETSINLQQENTSTENRDKLDTVESHPATITERVKKIAKKRGFKKTLSHTPAFDKSGNIYLASSDGRISAIDPAGNTKWYIQLADKINTGFAISSDNVLYFSSEKTLYAIDLNGTLKWIFNADNTIDFPSVIDNKGNIYVVTKRDDFLYAIRPNGSLYWKAHINGHISTPPSITMDGRIYITTQNNILYAINADGSLRWRREIYCRSKDKPISGAETVSAGGSNNTPQSNAKSVRESQEQNPPQALRISYVKSEEIHTSSKEADKPSITSFTASTLQGNPPLSVKFSDTSAGEIINRCWDFGDGTLINSEQSPVHTYTTPGNYDVRLIISRHDSTATIVRRNYITLSDNEALVSIANGNNP
ncbi:MAG TPA: outer membrane protein assembly factor BamB family protein [Candidatus Wunengus sp. YC60]|uniref:outer membrane protein assembly factor BamB family protein n=1 Tax=Candidatus Wunengus sp. YC60 TaxID=3367697 RepID=UPI004026B73C